MSTTTSPLGISDRVKRSRAVARRDVLLTFGLGIAGFALTACTSKSDTERDARSQTERGSPPSDLEARFAQYTAAPEPDGDLAKVVWPAFVTRAGPEVQRLYEFQIANGELMRYMPCFCGCGGDAGHKNNRDCYIRSVGRDGSVVFDTMAPT